LLICSSFCENGVRLTLMPVAFSKFGMTGLGGSSSQLMMLNEPEVDWASAVYQGPTAATSPAVQPAFSFQRDRSKLARWARH